MLPHASLKLLDFDHAGQGAPGPNDTLNDAFEVWRAWRFVSAVQNLDEECPGQQSSRPPAAIMEAPPSPELPPEPVPATVCKLPMFFDQQQSIMDALLIENASAAIPRGTKKRKG
jgi:hypothetical protein